MSYKKTTPRGRLAGYHPSLFKAYLIARGYDPPKKIASQIGISERTCVNKLSGSSAWNRQQLLRLKVVLHMSNDDFCNLLMDSSDEYIQKVRESYGGL